MQATSLRIENSTLARMSKQAHRSVQIELLSEFFSARAAVSPTAPALVGGGRSLSFSELDALANGLAKHLTEFALQPDDRVAYLADRSVESIIALLAILKAGAACIPLDPTYPLVRLRTMLTHSEARLLLVPGADPHQLAYEHSQAIHLAGWSKTCAQPPTITTSPEHLAYVLYTSGSTGTPKGVAMPHRTLVNLIEWHGETYPLTTGRTLQYSSPSFDVSFQELFTAWHSGGAVVLISEEARRDPAALLRVLDEQAIEALFCPVVALQMLAEAATGPLPKTLHHVFVAGEQLRITEAVRAVFARSPHTLLHNHYGPAETHVVTAHTLSGLPASWPTLPPIGQPIANVTIHLLPQAEAESLEEAREISLGGVCVARGYLNSVELTRERFVTDPAFPGLTFYRTGDLAQALPNGDLQFLGRLDDQIKVSGYRIEPAEIEHALEQHPSVRQAAVKSETDRLLAFITPAPNVAFDEAGLRHSLAERLPHFMVPSRIFAIAALPLTPSGKVNRRLLAPELEAAPSLPTEETEASHEAIVTACWCEVLQLPSVAADQNFFDLGGTSLLIVKLQQLLATRLQLPIEVTQLFEYPTIQSFTNALATTAPAAVSSQLIDRASRQRQARARASFQRKS